MYTPRQNLADLQLLNGYNLRGFIVDYANHRDDLQQAMLDAKGSITLNPVIRTCDWGSDLVEDSTGTTKNTMKICRRSMISSGTCVMQPKQ